VLVFHCPHIRYTTVQKQLKKVKARC